MNKVILMGRLTADPELRQTPNGNSVAKFLIAVNRKHVTDNGPTADFISCVAWGKNAENIAKFFHKGKMIAVVGELQISSWEKDGQKHYRAEVSVGEWDFTGDNNRPQEANFEPMNPYEPYNGE